MKQVQEGRVLAAGAFEVFVGSPAEYDLVSFDVFDTLISRAVQAPTDVFRIVRAKLVASRCALFDPKMVDSFPELRVEAERLARVDKERTSGCDEVTFDEIFATLARLSGSSRDTLEILRQSELDTEREVAYANPRAVVLLHAARRLGKQVVFCSDMYLPTPVIRDLLRSCGYDGAEPLYVSCEQGASKHHGTLFGLIAKAHNVAPARIVHVGDNPHADVAMAVQAGCKARPFPHAPTPETPPTPWTRSDNAADAAWSVLNGLLLKRQKLSSVGSTPWNDLGFSIYGPLFTGFLLWLRHAVTLRRPDRILLFARDTHWLGTVLHRFLADGDPAVPISYVHVSRAALLLPSMTDFPIRRLPHLFSGRISQPVSAHLHRFGLEPGAFGAEIFAAGFSGAEELVANGDSRMIQLMSKLAQPLLRECARRRPIVQEYLEPFVAGAKDVMLVDIGWVGNMQASFLRLLGTRHPALRVRGYYVGVFSSAADNIQAEHPMHGWLARPDDPTEIERAMWWAGGVELLEFAMRAPHGTTLGYERSADGVISPIIESHSEEDALTPMVTELQDGAAAFVDAFLASFGTASADGLNSRAWAAPFYRLVTAPTAGEAELLGDVTHSDNAGASGLRIPLAPRIDKAGDRAATLSRCYWPPGFLARNALA